MSAPWLRSPADTDDPSLFAVQLLGREPFLDHHRPGGHPLLGTVMGVELMSQAAIAHRPAERRMPRRISDVTVFDPIILHGPTAIAHVRAKPQDGDAGASYECEIETTRASTVRHFTATVEFGSNRSAPPLAARVPGDVAATVTAAEIYATFFHGPAFQVIDTAGLHGDTLVAKVVRDPVGLTTSAGFVTSTRPQLVEACLQTAGLLEVATRARLMIPRRIGSIEFFGDDAIAPHPLVTIARRSIGPGPDAIDIDLVDAAGRCRLRIDGYETLPLPFPADDTAVDALSSAFRRAR